MNRRSFLHRSGAALGCLASTVGRPLLIGGGETDSFTGKLRDARVYRRALPAEEIRRMAGSPPED